MTIQPRFVETDALGHINNTVLPVWFEQGRSPIFKIFVPSLSSKDWNMILAKIEVEFVKEIFYEDSVEIRTAIERIGNSSFVVYQEAWQRKCLAAKGRSTTVHYDFTNKKPLSIPENIRIQLSEHLIDA